LIFMEHVSNTIIQILASILSTTLNKYNYTLVELINENQAVVKDQDGNLETITDIGQFLENLRQNNEL
jgi:hypothetical protein